MNKIVSIKLPILALAMVFTISCSSDKDSGENLSSGSVGENLSSSNEQNSSSSSVQSSSSVVAPPSSSSFSSVQSSSSGIFNCGSPMVGTGTENAPGCVIPELHFTDNRDGKVYVYVKIGTGATAQTWMKENLNYDVPNNDTDVCYNKDPDNCTKYGRLYNWETAMSACPNGWHLPSNADWQTLVDFAGGSNIAGKKLKAESGWNKDEGKSGNGTDDFGFSALPGGEGFPGGGFGDFIGVGRSGSWWSSSELSADNAHYWSLLNWTNEASKGQGTKSFLYSVRCVKDN